jgi:hypothetical protein
MADVCGDPRLERRIAIGALLLEMFPDRLDLHVALGFDE